MFGVGLGPQEGLDFLKNDPSSRPWFVKQWGRWGRPAEGLTVHQLRARSATS